MTLQTCEYPLRGCRISAKVIPGVNDRCGSIAIGVFNGMPVCSRHSSQLRANARMKTERAAFAQMQLDELAAQAEIAAMLPGGVWRDKAAALRNILAHASVAR